MMWKKGTTASTTAAELNRRSYLPSFPQAVEKPSLGTESISRDAFERDRTRMG
jgi:hypothetical protein